MANESQRDAIKLAVSASLAGIEPTDKEQAAAIGAAVDLALGVVEDIGRIATALERLAGAVDGSGELNVYARTTEA